MPGERDENLVAARSALLDALEALQDQLDAVILIGAQAIYLHTGVANVALAETTKDSDLVLDARRLAPEPRLEEAMQAAKFRLDSDSPQPGSWLGPGGMPVDLMVPEALAGVGGRRGARIPPHSKGAARRARGLEAAVVDHAPRRIEALGGGDRRAVTVAVASPAALAVAKLHKIGERVETSDRLVDKDAHDLYRLLVAIPTGPLASAMRELSEDELAGEVTREAIDHLAELFAAGADALGSRMAGRAEAGIGEPAVVAAAASALAADLIEAASG